jgi:hypothetical protein
MDLESRTRATLKQFDSNMSGIFDRASFYDNDLYSQATQPQLSKSQRCFKYTLIGVNLLFLIFGAVLTSVGAAAVNNQIGQLAGSTLPTGITVLGVFILVLAIVGAIAAWKENRGLLGFYWIFLFLLTIILFFVGIAVYVERNNASSLIEQGWVAAPPAVKVDLSNLFNCCGLWVWDPKPVSTQDPGTCPAAVIAKYDVDGGICKGQTSDPACGSCGNLFLSTFKSYYTTAGACGIAFALIMIFGIVIVCYLMQGIKRKRAEQDLAKLRTQQPESQIEPEPLGEEETENNMEETNEGEVEEELDEEV